MFGRFSSFNVKIDSGAVEQLIDIESKGFIKAFHPPILQFA